MNNPNYIFDPPRREIAINGNWKGVSYVMEIIFDSRVVVLARVPLLLLWWPLPHRSTQSFSLWLGPKPPTLLKTNNSHLIKNATKNY